MDTKTPTVPSLLATMRKELGLTLNIRNAANAQIDALNKLVSGLGSKRIPSTEQVRADCEALTRARENLVLSFSALADWDNSKDSGARNGDAGRTQIANVSP